MVTKKGPQGPKGARGAQGARGRTGHRGATGERGERGPAGPLPRREDVLAVVEDQFTEMRRQLEIQLMRFAQLQVQLDQIHKILKQLAKEPS